MARLNNLESFRQRFPLSFEDLQVSIATQGMLSQALFIETSEHIDHKSSAAIIDYCKQWLADECDLGNALLDTH